MDTSRFDRISKRVAGRRSSHRPAVAQDATPKPDLDLLPAGDDAGEKTFVLFVQSFRSGSVTPKAGADGVYTVTLQDGLGQTVYFADRPARDVGALPTPDFLDALGFEEGNLPNAALVLETSPGATDIAVVELGNPTYETATHTATYDVRVLENWADTTEFGFVDVSDDLAAVVPAFGAAHVLIDDCPSQGIECVSNRGRTGIGFAAIHFCWSGTGCFPCDPVLDPPNLEKATELWLTRCNRDFPGDCKDGCQAVWRSGSPWNGT